MKKNKIIIVLFAGLLVSVFYNFKREDEEAFPMPGVVYHYFSGDGRMYEACDPVTHEPKIRAYSVEEAFSETSIKLFFRDNDNTIWCFSSSASAYHTPDTWSVKKYESPDLLESVSIPFSRSEFVQDTSNIYWENKQQASH